MNQHLFGKFARGRVQGHHCKPEPAAMTMMVTVEKYDVFTLASKLMWNNCRLSQVNS